MSFSYTSTVPGSLSTTNSNRNTTAAVTTTLESLTTGSPRTCNNVFELVGNNILTNDTGKFGRHFFYLFSCEELCAQNYGLLPCTGFLYEPNNREKCTIFQYNTETLTADEEDAYLYIRCNYWC
uniref:Apple domain-containing protein n=1 Tax=Acrobeloides nanus TaxID=290746 RepID=A0A914D8N3_9BILA